MSKRGTVPIFLICESGAIENNGDCPYLFLKAGFLFSTKAAMPSFWSSSANIE
jgi:hypothetical protein